MIAVPGLINLDFADVKTIMHERGSALMGIGESTGENRAAEAARKAIMSPLLETSIEGARGVIMNITGGVNLSLYEVNEAAEIVTSASDPEVNMIFGAIIDEDLKEEIKVTVIATGFEDKPAPPPPGRKPAPATAETTDTRSPNLRPFGNQPSNDQLDIPTFLRNRSRNNNND